MRRKNLRLCQQKHLTGKPSCSPSNRGRFFPSPSASSLSIATSSLASPGNQGPLTSELIPEKYHSLRDAKTYAELRRILDRNGKYLSRANIVVEASQGQCNQWQQRQGNGQTLLVTRDHDDGANSTCSEFWSGFNDGGGGSPGSATISATRQRVRKRERQLSRERCFDDDTALRYVRQQCATQDSSVAGRNGTTHLVVPRQTSLTSQSDVVDDRKALRDALYQGIFHRHRRTIFAVGSFLRMLKSRNSSYNTIRSSSEGEDDTR